ncbi:MAG: hypothetical protein IT371_26120 [Deltaproteobacteria bacterium]|nr:hypothetical protein [Deltaproteobacteria bacterium]
MRTVLFHSVGGDGLGHLARSTAIALELRRTGRAFPVLLTESRDTTLAEASGLPFCTLPARYHVADPARWEGGADTGDSLFRTLLLRVVEELAPSLFVHDTLIYADVQAELAARGVSQALVMRHRPTAGALASAWSGLRTVVLAEDFGAEAPEVTLGPVVRRVGPIVRSLPQALDESAVRARYELAPNRFTVVIANGGGGVLERDEFLPLVGRALVRAADQGVSAQVVAVVGPLYRGRLDALARVPDLRLYSMLPDFLELCACAQLVLSRGGYNSAHELAALGVPTLCVPTFRHHDRQDERILRAERQGTALRLAAADPEALSAQIADLYRAPWYNGPRPGMQPHGAAEAALALLDSMEQR